MSPNTQISRAMEIRDLVRDAYFPKLDVEFQRLTIQAAATGRGTAVELMKAAQFEPGPRITITSDRKRPEDREQLLNVMRREMIRSTFFRKAINHQNENGRMPIKLELVREKKGIVVDEPKKKQRGVHVIDMNDLQRFPQNPVPQPNSHLSTQGTLLLHVITESIGMANEKNDYYDAHKNAIAFENQYRREFGMPEIDDTRPDLGRVNLKRERRTITYYKNGAIEEWRLNKKGDIIDVTSYVR
jgi:hypothetical protein